MIFIFKANKFCLVALSIQIFKTNMVSAYEFPGIRFILPHSGLNYSDFFSSLHVNIGGIRYAYAIKQITLAASKLASNLHKELNSFIQSSNDLLTHFKMPKFSWNWIRQHPSFYCSKLNDHDIKLNVEQELFGQHLVSWSMPQLLKDHFKENKAMKPLLMSYQGPTGCGKSFLTKLMVESLFKEGFNSKFVHTYYGSRDFFHEKEKENYQKRLLHEIPYLLSLCNRSMFIFEEVDKMVPGVIDVIIPYIYFYKNSTEGYSTNSMFIFISNSGADIIEEMMYDAWLKGVSREDMTLENFTFCLKAAMYNERGGLQFSEIIKYNLIDVYLPFLPLERQHVKQCILKEFNLHKMSVNKNVVEYIANQIIYKPSEFELFAESGCKRVSQKVYLFK